MHTSSTSFTFEQPTTKDALAENRDLTLRRLSFIRSGEIKSDIINQAYEAVGKAWDGNIQKLIHQTDKFPYGFTTFHSIETFKSQNHGYTHLFRKDNDISDFVNIFFSYYSELFNQIARPILRWIYSDICY
jgi:hypothetical protein